METLNFVYWEDGPWHLGYLEDYPDYHTQGESLEEFKKNLRSLYDDLTSGDVPGIRKVAKLEVG